MSKEDNNFRIEKDTLGDMQVPNEKYWGAQTQRSVKYFNVGKDIMPQEVIHALAIIKLCAAKANKAIGALPKNKEEIIIKVAEEILAGKLNSNFPLHVWQTGSGTQSNMNVNEVIANRAIALLGGTMGSKTPIHPNDDVNKSQSSNDSFPTAMNVATVIATNKYLIPALDHIIKGFQTKVKEFASLVKIGRTHMQDATPLTLGQEFSGYLAQLEAARKRIITATESLHYLAQGATAVGTGINCPDGFVEHFIKAISSYTKIPFKSAPNKFASIASHDDLIGFSGALNSLAVALTKICNDIRLIASGPRAGLGEISLPANEPGSSIMPGKVNPTQIEAVTMVCAQVMGNHFATTLGGMQGQLELNAYKPLIIFNVLSSVELLASVMVNFTNNCLIGIQPNITKMQTLMQQSLMLVTYLNKHIGYDKAAKIANKAHLENLTLKEAALALGFVSEKDFDAWVHDDKLGF
ncbi:Fumarate hydratase class II [Candidatus Hepatincola sp. Av]